MRSSHYHRKPASSCHSATSDPELKRETASPALLLEQVRARVRRLGLARRTEEAYCGWIKRFVLASGRRHPLDVGVQEVEEFLTRLATERSVAAATQNQALAAVLFLYREVLGRELPWMDTIQRAKTPERVPTVLSRDEVRRVLAELEGVHWLIGNLLYGSGLRLLECLRLRVQDLDFARCELLVRRGKGNKDRRSMLPSVLHAPLQRQLEDAQRLHRLDLSAGYGEVWLPDALSRKYPGGGQGVGLAVGLSVKQALAGPANRQDWASSRR